MTDPTWGDALPDIVPTALHCLSAGRVPRRMATWAGSDAQHIVLWLIDGFGYHQMTQALEKNLMPHLGQLLASGRARLRSLSSVYPSVTPVALASLLTGTWPGQHGLVGRYLYVSDIWPRVDTLGSENLTGRLALGAMRVDQLAHQEHITYTALIESRLMQGALTGLIHPNPAVLDTIVSPLAFLSRLLQSQYAQFPTLTYAYWPYLDAINHQRGVATMDWQEEVTGLDNMLVRVTRKPWKGPNPRWLWVTADHGHHPVQESLSYHQLRQRVPSLPEKPLGTERLLGLWLTDTRIDEVKRAVSALFGDRVRILAADTLWSSGWLGRKVNTAFHLRLGHWVLEAQDGAFWDLGDQRVPHVYSHGGRSVEELTVPWLEVRLD